MAPKKGDYKGLALILQETKSRRARSYRVGWANGEMGFVKGNRAKESSSYSQMDLAFTANDGGGCGD